MYNGLKSQAVTFDNFKGALSSYSPPAGNAAELANMVALTLNDERNFRAFMVYDQLKQDGTTNPCDSCNEGCTDFDFTLSDGGFTHFDGYGYGNEGIYTLGSGWRDSYDPHGGSLNNLLAIRSPDVVGCVPVTGFKLHINVVGVYAPINGIDYIDCTWETSGNGYHPPSGLPTPTPGMYELDFADIMPDPTLDNLQIKMNAQAADWYITSIEFY